jgi:hypothetical protein
MTPSPVAVESLERRQLMARTIPIIAQQFVGTVEQVTSVVLTFDRALDPTTAQNTAAYAMVEKFSSSDSDGGFFDGEDEDDVDSDRIRIETAAYDATNNTVTLTPRNPFNLSRHFTVILVRGRGDNAVLEASGAVLDGDGNGRAGGDAILRFRTAAKKNFTFRDADGDRARLKVEGPGRIFYLISKFGRSTPSIFLRDADPASTILTGTVKQARNGDGVADIAQLNAVSTALQTIATDPAFRIRAVVP